MTTTYGPKSILDLDLYSIPMIPYYFLAAVFWFGSRRDESKGVSESAGKSLAINEGSRQVAIQGGTCAIFERRASELCLQNSKDKKRELCVIWANCKRETLGLRKIEYDSKNVAKLSGEERTEIYTLLGKLPQLCITLATYGLNFNTMSVQHTINMIDTTNDKLEEITRIAANVEKENHRAAEIQNELMKVSEESLNESKSISESSMKMEHSIAGFSNCIDLIINSFAGFERLAEEEMRKGNETMKTIWNFTEQVSDMTKNLSVTAYASRETQLVVEVMQYELLLVVIVAWYVLSKASFSPMTIVMFIFGVIFVAVLSLMHFSGFITVFRTGEIIFQTFRLLTRKERNFLKPAMGLFGIYNNSCNEGTSESPNKFGSIIQRIVSTSHVVVIVICVVLLSATVFTFPALRSMIFRKPVPIKEPSQDIHSNFDFHNRRDVLALLEIQNVYIKEQKLILNRLLHTNQSAIEANKQMRPAIYGRPVIPNTEFLRNACIRSPVFKFETYSESSGSEDTISTNATYVSHAEMPGLEQYMDRTLDLVGSE